MKSRGMTTIALVLVSVCVGAGSVSASSKRDGDLHITKNCTQYFAAVAAGNSAGAFCTITDSNIPEIPNGSKVYYDQAIGTPAGFLDSNVLINAGAGTGQSGDWAVGRCTLDLSTGLGLCTFSDGTGPLARFKARVDVSPSTGGDFRWDGRYSFSSVSDGDDK